ncbi:hypothetical protein ACFL6U_31460, partial [Planctomycetota bacterium]
TLCDHYQGSITSRTATTVQHFKTRVRQFYYAVMLSGCCCPTCNGALVMIAESRCRCDSCSQEFDPTVKFQSCSHCGGTPILKVRRYCCKKCNNDIRSAFLFDGIIYDPQYFCQKMAESRQRKAQQRQRVRQMLAESRSSPVSPGAIDIATVPGLTEALEGLVGNLSMLSTVESKERFDLKSYQDHILSFVNRHPMKLRAIPALVENPRLDLVWKFIAVIFLEHSGLVHVRQQDRMIWVMRYAD